MNIWQAKQAVNFFSRRLRAVLNNDVCISYSQEGEDILLRKLFPTEQHGFYVDVGAHHPIRYSNTWQFYQRGWTGINIEPNVDVIEQFQRFRPKDTNLCIGISDEPGVLTYYAFNEPALNSFDHVHAKNVQAVRGYWLIDTRAVPVVRLDHVLEEYLPAGRTIDVLSIDAEGHDFRILQSNDWKRFRPRCLLVEAWDSPLETIMSNLVYGFLHVRNYQLIAKTINTLFFVERKI